VTPMEAVKVSVRNAGSVVRMFGHLASPFDRRYYF
jgi:hypothetical protein